MKYTVKQVKPTGKEDPTYGVEYFVQFNEDARTVKVSRKQPIAVGQEFEGTINENKYGAYFKKDPTAFTPSAGGTTSSAPRNSDGQRQGMCINNAAAAVNAANTAAGVKPTAEAWAEDVYEFANALYAKGDLGQVEVTPAAVVEESPLIDPFA